MSAYHRSLQEDFVIDPVLDWHKHLAERLLEHLKKTKELPSKNAYQAGYAPSFYMIDVVLEELGVARINSWKVPPYVNIHARSMLVNSYNARYKVKGKNKEIGDPAPVDPLGMAKLTVDQSPMYFVMETAFDSSSISDHVFVVYRDAAQVAAFNELYSKTLRKILVQRNVLVDLSNGNLAPRPRVSMDDVILPVDMKNDLLANTAGFFQNSAVYGELGVPWKRGIILAGPPGTGKTMFVKALSNVIHYPFTILRLDREMNDRTFRGVFRRACGMGPCVMIMEDLDRFHEMEMSMSTLLNALDGVEDVDGLLIIATTNHPEQIDPALLSRPSRFDRKYHFALPQDSEKTELIRRMGKGHFSEEKIASEIKDSNDFSMASVKEVVISALLRAALSKRGSKDEDLTCAFDAMREEIEYAKSGTGERKAAGFKTTKGRERYAFPFPAEFDDSVELL